MQKVLSSNLRGNTVLRVNVQNAPLDELVKSSPFQGEERWVRVPQGVHYGRKTNWR